MDDFFTFFLSMMISLICMLLLIPAIDSEQDCVHCDCNCHCQKECVVDESI